MPQKNKALSTKTTRDVQTSAKPSPQQSNLLATVDHIIECARRVLIEHGHAGFTTRLVAKTAGISPGNLSYHFPSKTQLLQSVIARLLNDYSSHFEALVTSPNLEPGHELQILVQWLMNDTVADEPVRVFRELWAMSSQDVVIRDAVNSFYDQIIEHVEQLLRRSYPTADKKSISELVHVLALFTEGSSVLYGTGHQHAIPYERIKELVTPLLVSILKDTQVAVTAKSKRPTKSMRR
jgi:AcrR family transcriptional regulator